MQSEVWSSFTRDPRDGQFRMLRASDQDRSLVQQVLSDAYADGRLDRDEFDERSEAARTVRVLADIEPLLQDLVAPRLEPGGSLVHANPRDLEQLAEQHWQRRRRESVFGFLGISTLTTAIWFATAWDKGDFTPYFFWPGILMALSVIRLVRVTTSRQEIVADEVRRLQKRQAKELRSRTPRRPTDWRW